MNIWKPLVANSLKTSTIAICSFKFDKILCSHWGSSFGWWSLWWNVTKFHIPLEDLPLEPHIQRRSLGTCKAGKRYELKWQNIYDMPTWTPHCSRCLPTQKFPFNLEAAPATPFHCPKKWSNLSKVTHLKVDRRFNVSLLNRCISFVLQHSSSPWMTATQGLRMKGRNFPNVLSRQISQPLFFQLYTHSTKSIPLKLKSIKVKI